MTGAEPFAVTLLALAVLAHGVLSAERLDDQPAIVTWLGLALAVVVGAAALTTIVIVLAL